MCCARWTGSPRRQSPCWKARGRRLDVTQLPLKAPQLPSKRDHKALKRGTLKAAASFLRAKSKVSRIPARVPVALLFQCCARSGLEFQDFLRLDRSFGCVLEFPRIRGPILVPKW